MGLQKVSAKTQDASTRLVREKLAVHFPRTDTYRFNIASIRVRVVDKRFAGLSRGDREKLVLPIIDQLPKPVRNDIVFLALFAPNELDDSSLNQDFEDPERSLL